jgi:hypothetical protein
VNGRLERDLLEQRTALCLELQAQRAVIARQLGAEPLPGRAFPRSQTMRLLAHRPLQALRLLVGLIGLVRR